MSFIYAINDTLFSIMSDTHIMIAKDKGIITFVDSSQGAGKLALDMKNQAIDFLAFTGHKDLLALPGVGGLCCESKEHFEPLIQGGTGIHGEEYTNPDIFPVPGAEAKKVSGSLEEYYSEK